MLVEFLTLLFYFLYAEVYFLLTTVLFVLYGVLKYYDGDEYTGFRSWQWLRRRTLFGKSVKYMFGNQLAFTRDYARDRMLFVVGGGNMSSSGGHISTHMGLIHGFCMHGGIFQHIDLVVLMPWILFKIPLLRDILLWFGCVATPLGSADLIETQILQLLRKGKSVVYSVATISPSVFEFAIRNKIQVVPVRINGENDRYYVGDFPLIQQWFMGKIGWPFPFWFFPRIFSKKPLEKLVVQIGTPMDGSIHETPEKFAALFMGQFI